jgi:hypothetical protein
VLDWPPLYSIAISMTACSSKGVKARTKRVAELCKSRARNEDGDSRREAKDSRRGVTDRKRSKDAWVEEEACECSGIFVHS